MIIPRETQTSADVAGHYDELDFVYREIWGEHVHHGLWRSGREPPERAVEALVDLVAERLGVRAGERLIDIGCGYGASAARIAALHGAHVTGVTLSAEQLAVAAKRPGDVAFQQQDWLANAFADQSFDRALCNRELRAHGRQAALPRRGLAYAEARRAAGDLRLAGEGRRVALGGGPSPRADLPRRAAAGHGHAHRL